MRVKRAHIVPGVVLSATFVGVIPACAIEACGGQTATADGGDATRDQQFFGGDVAAEAFLGGDVAFCCFEAGVADVGFDADADAPLEASETSDGEPSDGPEGG